MEECCCLMLETYLDSPVNLRTSCVMLCKTSCSESVSIYSDSCPAIQPHRTWPYLKVKPQTVIFHWIQHKHARQVSAFVCLMWVVDLSVGLSTVKPNSFFIQDVRTSGTWSTMASWIMTRDKKHSWDYGKMVTFGYGYLMSGLDARCVKPLDIMWRRSEVKKRERSHKYFVKINVCPLMQRWCALCPYACFWSLRAASED